MDKLTKEECKKLWSYIKKEYNSKICLEQYSEGRVQRSYAREAAAWKTLVDKVEAETGYSGEPKVSRTYFEVWFGDELITYAKTLSEAKACAESYCRTVKGDHEDNLDHIDILECECGNCMSAKSVFDNE